MIGTLYFEIIHRDAMSNQTILISIISIYTALVIVTLYFEIIHRDAMSNQNDTDINNLNIYSSCDWNIIFRDYTSERNVQSNDTDINDLNIYSSCDCNIIFRVYTL